MFVPSMTTLTSQGMGCAALYDGQDCGHWISCCHQISAQQSLHWVSEMLGLIYVFSIGLNFAVFQTEPEGSRTGHQAPSG